MFLAHAQPAVPQMVSHDGLVRLTAAELGRIVFEHLCTIHDDAVLADWPGHPGAARRAGYTEWQGRAGRQIVSLAWDWVQLADGGFRRLEYVAPRTNVRVIEPRGYDRPPQDCGPLWEVIAALAWQDQAAAGVARLAAEASFEMPACRRTQ